MFILFCIRNAKAINDLLTLNFQLYISLRELHLQFVRRRRWWCWENDDDEDDDDNDDGVEAGKMMTMATETTMSPTKVDGRSSIFDENEKF